MMFKKIVGTTLLATLLIAPLMLITRNAEADPRGEICYFSKAQYRLGVVVDVDPDLAELLIRSGIAVDNFEYLRRSYRGYELCQRFSKRR